MRKLLLAAAVLLGSASLGASPTAEEDPARPSILLITLDTTRADHTSAYGYARPTTPRLEELVKRGIRFDAAYAPMATTLPSHATMFTALLPRSHGTLKNGIVVDGRLPMLAEVLAKNGYRTAAFLSSFVVAERFGLARGFGTYDDDFEKGQCKWDVGRWEGHEITDDFCRRGNLTRARSEKWLEANGYLGPEPKPGSEAAQAPPFFLWLHFFDAHNPYDPPAEQRALFPPLGGPPSDLDRDIAAYDAEIHFADQEMGKLLDRLAAAGHLDDTLVIVAGDHGEGLMQHGWMLHGLQIYEEAVRVPFVVRWPAKLPVGKKIAEPVQLADLMPTVLELAGLAMPQMERKPDGQSVAAALRGNTKLDSRRAVLLQRRSYARGWERGVAMKGEKHAVRVGSWKYIEAKDENTFELYDLASDPGEKRNVFADKPEERASLASTLQGWLSSPLTSTAPRGVSEEDARRLEALGYVQ